MRTLEQWTQYGAFFDNQSLEKNNNNFEKALPP